MTESEYITHVEHLRPLLLRVGREFFHSGEEAEDVAQEALLRLWLCRDRLPDGRELESLAVRIAKNVCISMWRKQRLREALSIDEGIPLAPMADEQADSGVADDEQQRLLALAVRQLTPSERRLFLLRQEADMTLDLMARITGMQPRSISSKLSAARRKVYEYIKQHL